MAAYRNNFDFLRFLGASLIIISHAFALSLGYGNVFEFDSHLLIGQFGLATLLVISGYLIIASWERQPDFIVFFKKRLLRVAPALIVSILAVLLIIGPIVTTLSLQEYFAALLSPSTWTSLAFYKDGSSLGLFTTNPVTYVDAPLWAIPLEFFLYIVVAVMGIAGLLRYKNSMVPAIAVTVLLWAVCYLLQPFDKIRFMIYFFVGAFLWINRERIAYRWYYVALLWMPTLIFFHTQVFYVFAFIAIPYTVIWFADLPLERLHNFGKYGDFSFGMFIYGYPIQQSILHFMPSIEIGQFIILSFAFTIPAAVLSWYLIERHALAKKDKIKADNDL